MSDAGQPAQSPAPARENERDARIAPTAHYTAYVWHRLHLPRAELFATRKGAALFWATRAAGEWLPAILPRIPSMPQYLAMRHRLIEHGLELVAPDAIVELGAGLSRRGVTWALDRGVRYVEVDLPHMIEAKRAALARGLSVEEAAAVAARLTLVARDLLADDFGEWLRDTLAGAARPAIVIEGVLSYFEPDEQLRIARAIRVGLSRRGGAMLCDLRAREGGLAIAIAALAVRAGILVLTRGRGAAADFPDIEAIRRFFADAGFDTAAPLDAQVLPDLANVVSPAQIWLAWASPSGFFE